MQHVFTNPRFGDGSRIAPVYWAFYQSNFYWIENPHAIGENVVNVAMSAGVLTPGGTTTSSQLARCQVPDALDYQELWVYDHHVVAVTADSFILTVQVRGGLSRSPWSERRPEAASIVSSVAGQPALGPRCPKGVIDM